MKLKKIKYCPGEGGNEPPDDPPPVTIPPYK